MSRYRGTLTATQLKVAGIELYSAGDFGAAAGTEALVLQDHRNGIYKRLVIRDNRLRGAVLYGDAKHGAWYFELMFCRTGYRRACATSCCSAQSRIKRSSSRMTSTVRTTCPYCGVGCGVLARRLNGTVEIAGDLEHPA